MNEVEDQFVTPIDESACWYGSMLRSEQAACLGRAFDFSDHVVLYYAQILPIALMETLYAFQYPYWNSEGKLAYGQSFSRRLGSLLPFLLLAFLFYLQFITAAGAYKTAAFFHTFGEVCAGFLVSLLAAVPLLLLQCGKHNTIAATRAFFFYYHS